MADDDLQFPGLVDEATAFKRARHSMSSIFAAGQVDDVWVDIAAPEGVYDEPAPVGRIEMVGDEKRAVCNVDRMPDVVYVNGVRFIPAGGR